jgi:hypothetical protein
MSNEKPEPGLDGAEMEQLLGYMESDQELTQESILASELSFRSWISSHPAMRRMIPVDKLSEVMPSLFKFVRALLGFGPKEADEHADSANEEGLQG